MAVRQGDEHLRRLFRDPEQHRLQAHPRPARPDAVDLTPAPTRDEYRARFRDPGFGLDIGEIAADRFRLPRPLVRKIEGSNLVFRAGDGRWLKICPPFWADAFDAEVRVTAAAQGRLTAPIPQILDSALIGDWRCLVSTHVPGVPIQDVLSTLGDADLEHIAGELGGFMRSFHDVEVPDFERAYGPWSRYLEERLAGAEALHRERGVEPARINEIAALLEARAGALRALGPAVLVHADLTAEHVMLTNHDGRWRLSGVLDLADAMHAPAALDLVTPFVELFRGRRTAQRGLMREAGIDLAAPFSETMMAIALQHSFIHFDAWFAPEIARGLTRVADIAAIVFPD